MKFNFKYLFFGLLAFGGILSLFFSPESVVFFAIAPTIFGSVDDIMEFRKSNPEFIANTVGETDLTARTGGQVLEAVNIDNTMVLLAQSDDSYRFTNRIYTRDINSTIIFFNRLLDYGDYEVDSFVGELDDADFKAPTLEQVSAYVSFLAEGYATSKVLSTVETLPGNEPETIQSQAAIHRILKTISKTNWYGDRSINSLEYDGLITSLVKNNYVADAEGGIPAISLFKELIIDITLNNGLVNNAWMHLDTKQTLDNYFVGAKEFVTHPYPYTQDGKPRMGFDIPGLRGTNIANGELIFEYDRWLNRHTYPLPIVRQLDGNGKYVWVEGKTGANAGEKAPDTPTLAVAVTLAPVTGSKWKAADVLNINGAASTIAYRVAARNRFGRSIATVSTATPTNILAGYGVDITITPAGTGQPATSFEIFRETYPGSGDFKLITRVAKSTDPTTTYQDINEWRAGCSEIVLGDFNSRGEASIHRTISMLRLLPLMETKFAPSAVYQRKLAGMIEFYGGLVTLAPEKFYLIKNVATKV